MAARHGAARHFTIDEFQNLDHRPISENPMKDTLKEKHGITLIDSLHVVYVERREPIGPRGGMRWLTYYLVGYEDFETARAALRRGQAGQKIPPGIRVHLYTGHRLPVNAATNV
jgi:hypothetical protein